MFTIKKMRIGEADPYAGRGQAYYKGTSMVWVLFHGETKMACYMYRTKRECQALADFANESQWDGESGDIEMRLWRHQGQAEREKVLAAEAQLSDRFAIRVK